MTKGIIAAAGSETICRQRNALSGLIHEYDHVHIYGLDHQTDQRGRHSDLGVRSTLVIRHSTFPAFPTAT